MEEETGEKMGADIKGLLVFYVDVGLLPPLKAEALVERMKDRFNESERVARLQNQGYEVLWIPVRPNCQTRLEVVQMSKDCMPVIANEVNIEEFNEEE